MKGAASDEVAASRPSAASDVGLSRSECVRRHLDYQRIYDRGAKVHGKFFTLFTLANTYQYGRLGIAATRKLGGAVVRNRAKRLIREVFRRNKIAPGMDVVVIPRRGMLDASPTAIETEFRHTLERGLRQRRRPN